MSLLFSTIGTPLARGLGDISMGNFAGSKCECDRSADVARFVRSFVGAMVTTLLNGCAADEHQLQANPFEFQGADY